MEKKICITTVVSGKKFHEYIPFFIYSILKSYPKYYIKIFCMEKLKRNVKRSLSMLTKTDKFEIIENSFKGYPKTNFNSKACRWLIKKRDLIEFDYAYIGDIDFLILPEDPGLLEQHINHCKTLGFPYSNIVRPNIDKKNRPIEIHYRMSGLHFIIVKEYFKMMNPIISEYEEKIKNINEGSNEKYLYKMIKEAFGEPKHIVLDEYEKRINFIEEPLIGGPPEWTPEDILFRPYHGIHFGAFKIITRRSEINKNYYGDSYNKFMKNIREDIIFKKIFKNSNYKIRKQLTAIDKYLKS